MSGDDAAAVIARACMREAFVRGFIAGRSDACQSMLTEDEVRELMPTIDEAYKKAIEQSRDNHPPWKR